MSLNRKPSNISVLTFSERLISVVRVLPSDSGLDVAGSWRERGRWSHEEGALGEALKSFGERHGLAGDRVFTVIPRHEVTVRVLELPSHDEEEIEGMVRLSAEEIVPYPVEELIVSQCILDRLEGGLSRVLAAVVHQNVIHAHLELLKGAGIEPEQIYLSTACLLSAAQACPPDERACYALLNLAAGGLEVLVMEGGRLAYGRGIGTESDWTFEGESEKDALEELCVEVRNSLSAHRRGSDSGTGAEGVVVCSEWADVPAVSERLAEEISCDCAPAAGLEVVRSGRDRLQGIPLASLGAALTAQGNAGCVIELMPEPVLRRRMRSAFQARVVRSAAMVSVVIAALACAYIQGLYVRKAYIGELEQRVEAIRPRVRDLIGKRRHIEELQRRVAREGTVLELLAGICKLAPAAGMNFTRFSFRHDDSITLVGRARELDKVDGLAEDLRRSAKTAFPQFAQARQMYTNLIKERGKDVWEYSISISFPAPEDEG